ncbi:MAG: leucine-rich repeat domain-containing protein [Lachnospiraceae bacterium]|nr:leucine-rich repeat domain-containing protein [Lachnospiraceae bacterium]
MMRRKIKTSMILVCILFTMLFTGCGKQADEDKTDEGKTNEATNNDTTASSTEDDIITDSNANIVVGDYVTFGVYEQDNDNTNGLEPIKWQVMDVSDGKALLVSCYILDNIEYNESEGVYGTGDSESNPWSQSYVYSWLNKDFAQTAFSEEELKIITDTTDYSVTDEYGALEGELIGSVFLPSYDEITKYFGTKTITITNYKDEEEEYTYSDMLLCRATPYANDERKIECETFTEETYNELKEKGFEYDSSVIGNEYSAYWLRSSLSWDSWFTAEGHALLVEEDGRIELGTASLNNGKTRRHGIRPCVWVNLENADAYLTITDGTEEEWFTNAQNNDTPECTWEIEGNRLIISGTDKIPKDWEEEDVPWYESAHLIEEVEIRGVEKVPSDLFYGCTALKKVILDDSITRMAHSAFEDCPSDIVIIYKGEEYTIENIEDAI